jgi:hypothetical protein
MKNTMTLQLKGVVLLGILVLTAVFLFGGVISQGQITMYCAEKTTYDAWCQNVPLDEVNTAYRYLPTSCESTSYCSTGTCVNTLTGQCLTGPQATCDSTQGGFFYSEPKDEVAQCKTGCCLLGGEASLVEQVRCDTLGRDYNVEATFRPDIQDELTCLALASPEAKGACVFETEQGRDCRAITRGECQDSAGEFHEGFLCTAPDLGTICTRTERTTCIEGRNEVYFVDSCGNIANIYDANKVDDIAYWSYIPGVEGVEVDIGDGEGNAGSRIYGYCDYLEGSTCRRYDRGIDSNSPRFGDYICRDLGCKASLPLSDGQYREHGEEWCSEPIENFENAKPGQLSYLLYCYDGEIQYELCDSFRNKLCLQDETTGAADCVVNKWMECIEQENTKDCENIEDCEIVTGASILRTGYGTEKLLKDSDTGDMLVAVCAPKYDPGFKFWTPEDTILSTYDETPLSICEFSSVVCFVPYTQEVAFITKWRADASGECVELCKSTEGWSTSECYEACTPVCLEDTLESKNADAKINETWAESWQNLCVSLGDCGISGNYLGREGYNEWRDLFSGEQIDWTTLPNADDKE